MTLFSGDSFSSISFSLAFTGADVLKARLEARADGVE